MSRYPVLLLVGFAVGAGGCHSSSKPPDPVDFDPAESTAPKCADIVLNVSPSSPFNTYGVGAGQIPSVSADLRWAPATQRIVAKVEMCQEPLTVPAPPKASGDSGSLRPIVDCVQRVDDTHFVAVFGYQNQTKNDITAPVGPTNFFKPGAQDRSQPSTYPPGKHGEVFTVPFDGKDLTWTLGKQYATASSQTRRCNCATTTSSVCTPIPSFTRETTVTAANKNKQLPIVGLDDPNHDRDDNSSGWEQTCTRALACLRVQATGYSKDGVITGSATAVIRRGDFVIDGQVTALAGQADAGAAFAKVVATVDDQAITGETDATGHFRLVNVPPGRVLNVEATMSPDPLRKILRGAVTPLATLDSTHPLVSVTVPLFEAIPPVDKFEPDNSPDFLAGRPAAALGETQSHSLGSRDDVDLVPLEVVAGQPYIILVSPSGQRVGDLALDVVDAMQTALVPAAFVNGQFAPALVWSPTTSGTVYARVMRRDDEPGSIAYDLTVYSGPGGT